MITSYLLIAIGTILSAFFSWLPQVQVLPFGMDAVFSTAVGYYNYFAGYNWPVVYPMTCALIYLSFELTLLVIKFFLGSRTPTHSI